MPCHVEALFSYSKEGQSCVKKIFFNKIVENSLDVLHPLITFNELPPKTSVRNSRTYRAKPCKTNRCHDTFINKCPSIFQ